MTVAAFKKKDVPKEPAIPRGTIVLLKSDEKGSTPMTTSDVKNGEVLCKWHDSADVLQLEWFHPDELCLAEEDESEDMEIVFTPEPANEP